MKSFEDFMLSKEKVDENLIKQGMNWLGKKMSDAGTAMTRDAMLQPGSSGNYPNMEAVLRAELLKLADKYSKVKPLDSTAWWLSKLLNQMADNAPTTVKNFQSQNKQQ